MTAPFAALEARLNSAVMRRLANTVATLDGVTVSGIFDQAYVSALDVASIGPGLLLATADTKAVQIDTSQVRILDGPYAGPAYTVRGIEPDGTGLTVLRLRKS